MGGYLTQIAKKGDEVAAFKAKDVAGKMLKVMAHDTLPDHVVLLMKNARPEDLSKFFTDMADVFAKSNIGHREMLKILQMRAVFSEKGLAGVAGEKTLGSLMEDLAAVAKQGTRESILQVRAVSWYAHKVIGDNGELLDDWAKWIVLGRRAEIEFLADPRKILTSASYTDLKNLIGDDLASGFRIELGDLPKKTWSDVDAACKSTKTGVSLKLQGETLESWANKSNDWLGAYFAAVKKNGMDKLVFVTQSPPSDALKARFKVMAEKHGVALQYGTMILSPPP